MNNNKPRFTLEEAEIILRKRACDENGHKYYVISKRQENKPVKVVCDRCDDKWFISDSNNDHTQVIKRVDDATQVFSQLA